MENITIAKRTVKTVLSTTLRMSLKFFLVTTQDVPLHTVALAGQPVELFIAGFAAQMVTEVRRSPQKPAEAPIFCFSLDK